MPKSSKCTTGVLLATLAAGIGAVPVVAQQNGRFASLKVQAFDLFERKQYAQVAGKLEEIWETDKSDPKVSEYLAMGYLYGDKSVEQKTIDKVEQLMKESIAKSGQATFIVQHSHGRSGYLDGDAMNNYCSGKMSIATGKMAFIDDKGKDSMDLVAQDVAGMRLLSGSPGRFQMKVGAKTLVFRVFSQTKLEAELLDRVAKANVK
jgi:hypothetical protein